MKLKHGKGDENVLSAAMPLLGFPALVALSSPTKYGRCQQVHCASDPAGLRPSNKAQSLSRTDRHAQTALGHVEV